MANENFKEQLDLAKEALEYQEKELEYTLKTDETFKSRVKTMNDIASNQNDLNKLVKIERSTTKEINRLNKIGHTAMSDKYKVQQILVQSRVKELRTQVLANKARDTADKLTGGMASKLKKGLEFSKGMGKAALAKYLAMGLVVGAVALLIKSLKFASDQIDTLGKGFGVAGAESGEFRDSMMKASVDVISLGKGTADVVSLVSTLSKDFGIALTTAAQLTDQILDTAVATGLTNEQAAKLFGTLMVIGDLTADQAESLAESTYQLARQNQVNPRAVLEDIADNSELIAKFGAENAESLAKAAVRARQLGLNLKTVDKISESLLNFQSSLNAEIEASIITGKRLNLNKARELALTGDTSAMLEEVISQLGDESDMILDNVLARKSLAAAVGIEVDEMDKLLNAQDKSIVAAKSFRDIAGDEAMSALTGIINKIKEIGAAVLTKLGTPLNNLLTRVKNEFFTDEKIAKITNFINNFEKIMGNVFKTVGNIANMFGSIAEFFTVKGFLKTAVNASPIGALTSLFTGKSLTSLLGVDDFKSAGGSHLILTPTGKMLQTNPNDTVMGSTKVNDFHSGPAGSMPLGVDMTNTNNKLDTLNANIEKLIDLETRAPQRLAGELGG